MPSKLHPNLQTTAVLKDRPRFADNTIEMGSTSSSFSSLLSSNSSTFAPATFTGVSSYSTDLQQVLSRAVSIAQLPIQALQADQAVLENKIGALQTLNPTVAAVGAAITHLGSLAGGKGLSASTSNSSLVSVTATGATSAANYTISNITSIASAASAVSAVSYATTTATPVSSAANLQLMIGSQTYAISLTPAQNNLQGLVKAINEISGGSVTASVLTTQSGDYLALSANSTGQVTALQLNDIPATGSAVNLLATSGTGLNLGSNANFTLDGIPISQSSNTINNVVPGLTFTIVGTTAANQNVNVSLAQDTSTLSSALQDFVNDYNSLLTAVNGHIGQSGGALTGESLLFQVESAMQQAVTYEGTSGSIKNLSNLGISLDNTGKMTLDSTVTNSMSSTQLAAALNFLGSSSTGFGTLAASFTQISDPISGIIHLQTTNLTKQDVALQTQVTRQAARLNTMQTNLQRQLAAADAAISRLQTQQQVITSSIQAVDLALYGQNFGSVVPSSS